MKKNIPTAEVRSALMHDIDYWLKEAAEKADEKRGYEIGSFQRQYAIEDEHRHRARARALYLFGESLGVISAEDYPQLGRREAQA